MNVSTNIRLAVFNHFYQPSWQPEGILTDITNACYRPFFRWASRHDGFAGSANINGSLLELLARYGHGDVIDDMRTAVAKGSLELVDTVAYHCILPLSTEEEIIRQVECDGRIKRRFGFPETARRYRGFYLPEYAVSEEATAVLRRLGYDYTIADDEIYGANHGRPVPRDRVITSQGGLRVFLRSRGWGKEIAECRQRGWDFDRFRRDFPPAMQAWFNGQRGYAVIATDGETYGWCQKQMIDWLLVPMLENWDQRKDAEVAIASFDDLLEEFGHVNDVRFIPPSTWSTDQQDMSEGNPFPLWDHQANVWHRRMWQMVELMRQVPDLPELHDERLRAMSSCGWWWVSKHSPEFAPRLMMENIDMMMNVIERSGRPNLIAAARQLLREIMSMPGFHR